jgi:hypothetical protein
MSRTPSSGRDRGVAGLGFVELPALSRVIAEVRRDGVLTGWLVEGGQRQWARLYWARLYGVERSARPAHSDERRYRFRFRNASVQSIAE